MKQERTDILNNIYDFAMEQDNMYAEMPISELEASIFDLQYLEAIDYIIIVDENNICNCEDCDYKYSCGDEEDQKNENEDVTDIYNKYAILTIKAVEFIEKNREE